ncbi:endolytic transglycosylase MltG [Lutispora thermophila]|uniref:Endolytic murein transglycosylase n=1 Tax=Lutispora thermophila DSM 19022 TaxID=1122184 RepID=A0A1M6F2P7_9FIRM|nr:endolytic transglycosylase MltG [Lutispora thermophila]SHI91935.1 UPF0755 protein [Lutispora thermophila DSM 19022]
MFKKRLLALVAFFIVNVTAASFIYYNISLKPVESVENEKIITITIPKGASSTQIGSILQENGIIRSKAVFRIYSKINKLDSKYKAGTYEVRNSMDVKGISELLLHGKGFNDIIRFTIPEGYEVRMIVDKLVELGLGEKEKYEVLLEKADFDYSFLDDINRSEGKLEGYLFPDTYEVYKSSSEKEILEKMLKRFDEVFTNTFKKRAQELNMSIDEVVTLASIIEREAKIDEDRKIISSVFHNRLKNNMYLQSCATIQYILKDRKEVLLYKDLEIESPYNTYKNPGLPPGPIASPGLKSIEAALYPADTEYLYFFAKDDGSHVFSKSFKEHLQLQSKYKSGSIN